MKAVVIISSIKREHPQLLQFIPLGRYHTV